MKRSAGTWIPVVASLLMLAALQGGCASEAGQVEVPPSVASEPLPASGAQQSPEEMEQLVGPDRALPGRTGCTDPGSRNLSHADRGGGSLAAAPFGAERRRARGGGRYPSLGPGREVSDAVSRTCLG